MEKGFGTKRQSSLLPKRQKPSELENPSNSMSASLGYPFSKVEGAGEGSTIWGSGKAEVWGSKALRPGPNGANWL